MIDRDKIEYAKSQMNKAISLGKKKHDVYSTVLNTASDKELANYLFEEVLREDFKTAILIYKSIDNKAIKERLKISFFNSVLEKEISKEVLTTLMLLEEENYKDYLDILFKNKQIILDYDDIIFEATIGEEKFNYYLDYVEKCYFILNKIPYNIEKLKHAGIKTNQTIQKSIKRLESIMYEKKDLDNLFFVADSTDTLNNIPTLFNCSENEVYAKIDKNSVNQNTRFLAYYLGDNSSELSKLIGWFNKISTEKATREIAVDLVITLYKIRTLEIEFNKKEFIKLNKIKGNIQSFLEEVLTEEEEYNIFFYFSKLLNKAYSKADIFISLLPEFTSLNPFISTQKEGPARIVKENKINQTIFCERKINFLKNKRVKKFLEKEKEVLKSEVIILLKQLKPSYDNMVNFYFNSIFNYIISFEDYINTFPIHEENLFKIYNTYVEGKFRYINHVLYLETDYGLLKIICINQDEKIRKTLLSKKEIVNLFSLDYQTKCFKSTSVISKRPKELLFNVQNNLNNFFKKNLTQDELKEISTYDFLIYSQVFDLIKYGYLYLKYKEIFKDLEEEIKELYQYKIDLEDDRNIETSFYKYILKFNREELLEDFTLRIEFKLNKFKNKCTTDLTSNKEFSNFRKNINNILDILYELDQDFYNDLREKIQEKGLESITYLKDAEEDYYQELTNEENSYIKEFYKVYPSDKYNKEEIISIINREESDLKFYLSLKVISNNSNWYYKFKDYLLNSNIDNLRYINWIKNLDFNINRLENSTLIYPIKNIPYNDSNFTDEELKFIDKIKSLFKYEENNFSNNSLKDILLSINNYLDDHILNSLKQKELLKEEKIKLAPILIQIICKKSLNNNDKFNILKTLDLNNPFNSNNDIQKEELPKIDENILKNSFTIFDSLSKEDSLEFYFISPMHFKVHFDNISRKCTLQELQYITEKYKFKGSLNIINQGKDVSVYITNILCKNIIKCYVQSLKAYKFRIIPFKDKLNFRITDLDRQIILEPIIDYSKEISLLESSLKDKTFYDSLTREEKEKVLLHYCRVNIVDAFNFDKEKIIKEEEYLNMAMRLSRYEKTSQDYLYLCLVTKSKEKFIEEISSSFNLKDKQISLLSLQKILLEKEDYSAYDTLIEYLDEINLLHISMLLSEGYDKIKQREKFIKYYKDYNENGEIEKNLLSENIEVYFRTKQLEVNRLKFSYENEAYKIYEYNNRKFTFLNENESLFLTYIILKEITIFKEIEDEVYNHLNRISPKINQRYINLIYENINLVDAKKVFDKYNELIIDSKSFEEKDINLKKLIAYSQYLPEIKELVKELLVRNNLLEYKNYLIPNMTELIRIKEKTETYFFKFKNTKKKLNDNYSCRLSVLEYLRYIYEKEYIYLKLESTESLRALIDSLLEKHSLFDKIIFNNKVYDYLSNRQRKILSSINSLYENKEVENVIKKINIPNMINSSWYQSLIELSENIDNVFNNKLSKEQIYILPKKLIELIRKIYLFEEKILDQNNYEEKMIIFISTLDEKQILSDRLMFNKIFLDEYNMLEKKFNSIKSSSLINKLILDSYPTIKIFFDKKLYEKKSNEEYTKYIEDNILSLYQEKQYYLALQNIFYLLLEYPEYGISKNIEDILNSRKLIVPIKNKKEFKKLFNKTFISILENNPKLAIKFIEITTYLNDDYSIEIVKNDMDFNGKPCITNLITNEELTNEEKIFIYLNTQLKYSIKIDAFIKAIYSNELENSQLLNFDFTNKYLITKQLLKRIAQTSLSIENLKEEYCYIEGFIQDENGYITLKITDKQQESSNIINDLKKENLSNLKTYITSRVNRNIKLLYNVNYLKDYLDIYKLIEILIENKKYISLKELSKILMKNQLLNNYLVIKEYDKFKIDNVFLSFTDFEEEVMKQIDNNNLKDELFKVFENTNGINKILLYCILISNYGYFDYEFVEENYEKSAFKELLKDILIDYMMNNYDYNLIFTNKSIVQMLSKNELEEILEEAKEFTNINPIIENTLYEGTLKSKNINNSLCLELIDECKKTNYVFAVKYLSKLIKKIKKLKITKFVAFDPELMEIYLVIYNASKYFYLYENKFINKIPNALVTTSAFSKDVLYEKIIINKNLLEESSSKTTLTEEDKYLLRNININEDYSKELERLLNSCEEKYKTYIYLVLTYIKNEYVDYDLNINLNTKLEEILEDLIIRYTLNNQNIEKFFDNLQEYNIVKIIGEENYLKIYNKAMRTMIENAIDKQNIQALRIALTKITLNKCIEDKIELSKKIPDNFMNILKEEQKEKLFSYFVINK